MLIYIKRLISVKYELYYKLRYEEKDLDRIGWGEQFSLLFLFFFISLFLKINSRMIFRRNDINKSLIKKKKIIIRGKTHLMENSLFLSIKKEKEKKRIVFGIK